MDNTIYSQPNLHQIPVRLDRLRHLYEAPDFDPFTPPLDYLSGIERIFKELRQAPSKRPVCVTIYLPQEKLSTALEQDCAAAIRRVCAVRIEQIDDELASIRWEGTRSILVGLLVWGVCLFLALFFGAAENLPEFPRQYISEGLIIAGWVALWYPIEIILYEWWGHNRDKKVYARMKEIAIRIACLDEASARRLP